MICRRPALFPTTISHLTQPNHLIYMGIDERYRRWPRSVWGETINIGVKTINLNGDRQ